MKSQKQKDWVICNKGTVGKNEHNNGDFYGSSGYNGMWAYHRWVGSKDARVFPSREKAQAFKDSTRNNISPIKGRVILKVGD